MNGLVYGSLFSGYEGLTMGVQSVLPGRTAWVCDYDTGPSKVLAHHWSDVPNLVDVTKVDWASVEPVDVITGGSPCQDVSAAGKRAGMRAGTRSGLWASMCDAIDTIRPSLVVWENVQGVLSAGADSSVEQCPICVGDTADVHLRALGRVLGDLAEVGYDAWWTTLRASDAGCPQRRSRVFVFAWPTHSDFSSDGPNWFTEPNRKQVSWKEIQPRRYVDRLVVADNWTLDSPVSRHWAKIVGREAPPAAEQRNGIPRVNPEFAEWLMGLPDGHVTTVPGLTRNEQLKLLGNGVVPQQAALATRMWLETL